MKAILISIKPKYCELIASGKKTVEVRKTRPKIDTPFKCYIYCTTGKVLYRSSYDGKIRITKNGRDKSLGHHTIFNCKVIGEFICDEITDFESEFWDDETYERIQKIVKDHEYYAEYGEYERETVSTNEDENYKENWLCKQSCVSWEEMRKYIGSGIKEFYGWHISNLAIYDEPKMLHHFFKPCDDCDKKGTKRCTEELTNCRSKIITRPPQSWCYVEELED